MVRMLPNTRHIKPDTGFFHLEIKTLLNLLSILLLLPHDKLMVLLF
jgi:hypothetical protein